MRISRTDQIAGQPIKRVRDLLRRLHDGAWSKEAIADWLDIGPGEIDTFVEEMLSRRFLRASPDSSGTYYESGEEGLRLANARLTKPINRAKANALIKEFLSRVLEVNKNAELVYMVAEVRVFGSYLGQTDELGDVDLAVKLRVRCEGVGLATQLIARADQSRRHFGTLVDRFAYPQEEVIRILKAKLPYIAIHDMDDLNRTGTASEIIYPKNSVDEGLHRS